MNHFFVQNNIVCYKKIEFKLDIIVVSCKNPSTNVVILLSKYPCSLNQNVAINSYQCLYVLILLTISMFISSPTKTNPLLLLNILSINSE